MLTCERALVSATMKLASTLVFLFALGCGHKAKAPAAPSGGSDTCPSDNPDCHGITGPIPDCCCMPANQFTTEPDCAAAKGTCAPDPHSCNKPAQ